MTMPGNVTRAYAQQIFCDGLFSAGESLLLYREVSFLSYAQQMFCDGFFSADPHPGNILVHRETLDPVLLDFGLVKRLDDPIRL
ncbi:hypothetical protein T484DRAFT_1851593 [Baffinella frigidus]|nr:hypothetical protein T484DRAFT_1851593 [Cryptophyta sp. CCMP2293]